MASVSQKGAISFGLVHIPVALYTATRENGIRFNQLHKDSMQRIRYKKVAGEEEVKPGDIVRGYEYEKGKYVVITDDELERVKTPADKTIRIIHFADLDSIDSIYYEKSYYALPDAGGDRAFELLRAAMEAERKIAVGRTVLGSKETLMAILPAKNGMVAETLYFADEIKPMPKAYAQAPVEQSELEMAKTLIGAMTKPFEPELYKDEYQERLRAAIEQKISGGEIAAAKAENAGNVISLMDALKMSLEQQKPVRGKTHAI